MLEIKVEELICVGGSILLVFYTPGKCWQFRVISSTGQVFGERRIYYSADAALNAGRNWLGLPEI